MFFWADYAVISKLRRRLALIRKFFKQSLDIVGLNALLLQFSNEAELPERMDLFRQLLRWLTGQGPRQVEARFRYLFKTLEAQPELNLSLSEALDLTLKDCRSFRLFTEVGVTVEHGLWGDIAARLLAKIVAPGDRHDTAQIFMEAFNNKDTREALRVLSPSAMLTLFEWLQKAASSEVRGKFASERNEAICFLAAHAAHYGLSSAIQRRVTNPFEITKSPFFQLVDSIRYFDPVTSLATIQLCEEEVNSVYAHLDQSGVSIDVVNRLETIEALLQRMKNLLMLQNPNPKALHLFAIEVINAQESGRSIFGYLSRHFDLLSRKVVERNGRSGEHYIAHTKSEMNTMFWSALGGGCIVVGMTILKIFYLHTNPAPFFLAMGIWIIYSIGFLAMQFSGATLATKIPSFTASRLAEILRSTRQLDHVAFSKEVRSTMKSQVIALLGNLCGVIPLALLFDQLLRLIKVGSLMDSKYAIYTLENLNPILSFAIPLGALTGLQLWLSSLAGGWFENWIVYNRIPEIVKENYRLRKIIGEKSATRLAAWIHDQSSGISTNVALGFLFGFTPLIGGILGLGWNGNHVTISTASAMFAFSALDFQTVWSIVLASIVGLIMIGLMNFIISFALALFIAARARKLQVWRMLYYLRRSL